MGNHAGTSGPCLREVNILNCSRCSNLTGTALKISHASRSGLVAKEAPATRAQVARPLSRASANQRGRAAGPCQDDAASKDSPGTSPQRSWEKLPASCPLCRAGVPGLAKSSDGPATDIYGLAFVCVFGSPVGCTTTMIPIALYVHAFLIVLYHHYCCARRCTSHDYSTISHR